MKEDIHIRDGIWAAFDYEDEAGARDSSSNVVVHQGQWEEERKKDLDGEGDVCHMGKTCNIGVKAIVRQPPRMTMTPEEAKEMENQLKEKVVLQRETRSLRLGCK